MEFKNLKARYIFMLAALSATALSRGAGGEAPVAPAVATVAPAADADAAAGRGLTPAEEAFTKSLFGDSFETGRIRLVVHEFVSDDAYATASGGKQAPTIHIHGAQYNASDYTTTNGFRFMLFVRAMTSVWVAQTDGVHSKNYVDSEDYRITPKSKFTDFGPAQQASIMADYCRRHLLPVAENSLFQPMLRDLAGKFNDTPMSDKLLRMVVEDFFPAAKKTRQAFEGQQLAVLQDAPAKQDAPEKKPAETKPANASPAKAVKPPAPKKR